MNKKIRLRNKVITERTTEQEQIRKKKEIEIIKEHKTAKNSNSIEAVIK